MEQPRRLRILGERKPPALLEQGSACTQGFACPMADERGSRVCVEAGCETIAATGDGVWLDGSDNPRSRFRCAACNCWRKKFWKASKHCSEEALKAFGEFDAAAKEDTSKIMLQSKNVPQFVFSSTM